MINDDQRNCYSIAANYMLRRLEKTNQSDTLAYPLNRGDLLLLLVLIEQELKAVAPCADLKRLAAVREKLGDLAPDTPEMTREEAQQFR
jgi:hypothetical protein